MPGRVESDISWPLTLTVMVLVPTVVPVKVAL